MSATLSQRPSSPFARRLIHSDKPIVQLKGYGGISYQADRRDGHLLVYQQLDFKGGVVHDEAGNPKEVRAPFDLISGASPSGLEQAEDLL